MTSMTTSAAASAPSLEAIATPTRRRPSKGSTPEGAAPRPCRRRHDRMGTRQMSLLTKTLLVVLMVAGVDAAPPLHAASGDSEWHEFSGIWTAAGRRHDIG